MRVQGIKDDIQGVIFDMDGLLVNSEYLYWQANIQAAKEANLGIPDDSYLKLVGASVEKMEEFYHKYFANKEVRNQFIARTDELVFEWTNEGKLKLQKGVLNALVAFQKRNVKMAIASSNYQKVIKQNLAVTKTKGYFDFYLSYDDVIAQKVKSKPAPDIYLLAQKEMQLNKENILVFEDSATGVLAAKRAGLKCVMIPDLKPATTVDYQNAVLVCDSFDDFLKKVE